MTTPPDSPTARTDSRIPDGFPLFFLGFALYRLWAGDPGLAADGWLGAGVAFAIVATMTLVSGTLISVLVSRDRRAMEDYQFQLVAQAALVAVLATLVGQTIWSDFLTDAGVRSPSPADTTAMMVASWTSAYLYYRYRGING